jgi:hypothetical protein
LIFLGIFVVEGVLGALAVLLLVAVFLLVAIGLLAGMFIHMVVVPVLSIALLLSEFRVSAVRLTVAAVTTVAAVGGRALLAILGVRTVSLVMSIALL